MLDAHRLWADLLSSITYMLQPGVRDLAADLGLADQTVHTWWLNAPGKVHEVHLEHSPGRLDHAYIGTSARSTRRSCSPSATARTGSSVSSPDTTTGSNRRRGCFLILRRPPRSTPATVVGFPITGLWA